MAKTDTCRCKILVLRDWVAWTRVFRKRNVANAEETENGSGSTRRRLETREGNSVDHFA